MKLFKTYIYVLLIALLFIGTDLFLIHKEVSVSRALKTNQMASLMTKLVKNLVEGQQTIALYPENNIKDILELLEEHHLQSIPILASKEERRIIGIVDSLDLVAMMLDKHVSDFERGPQSSEFWQNQTVQFRNTSVMQVIDYSNKEPVQTIHQSATLRDAIDTFFLKVHRVAVVDDRSRFLGVLSQSRVIEYLTSFDSPQQIPGLKSEICLKYFVTEDVVKTQDSLQSWKAFRLLREQDVTSLAVEEHNGLFYDVLSASDIKILNKHSLDVFLKSARDFIDLRKRSDRPPIAVFTDNLTPTIDIMRTMVREKIHRVFLLKEQRCSGVVSMTDILKQVSKETA